MANCLNCGKPMAAQTLEARTATLKVDVDACPECRLLWFDHGESLALTPRSVLALFQYIGTASAQSSTPLATRFCCLRCDSALVFTRDLQRTTPFNYWSCDFGHGRLISFNQFLREKNFIRTPAPVDLARLRETVRQITCSQCGAPIDLATDSACSHCRAPIAMIDPDSVAKAMRELAAPVGAASAEETRQALTDAQVDALFSQEMVRERSRRENDNDLLIIGAQAIGELVGAFLFSR
jgi:Zn-finger nucleic acid-binding protein